MMYDISTLRSEAVRYKSIRVSSNRPFLIRIKLKSKSCDHGSDWLNFKASIQLTVTLLSYAD